MELSTLLERCREGDDLAWEALVRRFQGRVYSVALHYMRNEEEARDLAQEIFIRIYRRLSSCSNDETFVPWMLSVARNAAVDRLRRMKTRPQAIGEPVEELVHLAATGPDPAEEVVASEQRRLVHRAMDRLSRINREILMLKEIQGLSLEAIAGMLRVPIGTVKSRSNRARVELAVEVVALSKEGRGGRPERLEP